jgi:hypothetical protein
MLPFCIPKLNLLQVNRIRDLKKDPTLQASIDKLSDLMDLAMEEMLFWEQDAANTLVALDPNDILEEYLPPQILGCVRGRGSLVPDQKCWLENILQEFEKEWARTLVPRSGALDHTTRPSGSLGLEKPKAPASSRSSQSSLQGKKRPFLIAWTHG